jgi:8-oxo-dGTP diphosphatase
MKDRKEKSRVPILAAGGVVLRNGRGLTTEIAVIQSRKLGTWGLPKGKLAAGEDAMTAARREVLEETGHDVTVHEFLGTLVYETNSRPKAVQFWRMEAADAPAGDLMRDVTAVDWLTLPDAIDRLSHMRERVFLEQAGPIALKLAAQPAGAVPADGIPEAQIFVQGVPLAPVAAAPLPGDAGDVIGRPVIERPVAEQPAPAGPEAAHAPAVETAAAPAAHGSVTGKDPAGNNLTQKAWRWFRCAPLLQRLSFD